MGDARRKKLLEKQLKPLQANAVERVCLTLKKLTTAASTHHGSDCYAHTFIGKHLFSTLGFDVEVAAGFAAWRVGQSDGSVVAHVPNVTGYLPENTQGFAYHAWLLYGNKIIDLTTYQLRKKAFDLDAADGGHTDVDWCPDFLYVDQQETSSYKQVAQGNTGLYYYERNISVESKLANGFSPDPEDLVIAEIILNSANLTVIGPNQFS